MTSSSCSRRRGCRATYDSIDKPGRLQPTRPPLELRVVPSLCWHPVHQGALLSKGGFEFEIVSPRVAEKFDAILTLSFRAESTNL